MLCILVAILWQVHTENWKCEPQEAEDTNIILSISSVAKPDFFWVSHKALVWLSVSVILVVEN
jgi:hypothetical protein